MSCGYGAASLTERFLRVAHYTEVGRRGWTSDLHHGIR